MLTYFAAQLLSRAQTLCRKRLILLCGCLIPFGFLFLFKYLNFFCDLLRIPVSLSLILPLGISFFTFAVTGYLFDVYHEKCEAVTSILDYSLFVAFFPSLLAGPIGQARAFLPQLKEQHRFSLVEVKTGILRFLYGMFQKMVIADTVAIAVNAAYTGSLPAASLRWIFLLYPLQIYFDFAGYSNMAIGTAQAFGFHLTENFETPYLSVSVRSFWKKWHISLTSWFREYLYFPLGGSRKGTARTWLNILIVFTVSGLWHGAAVTYLVWGLLNGLLQIAESILMPITRKLDSQTDGHLLRYPRAVFRGALTYLLIAVTWVFFRAPSISQAIQFLRQVLHNLTVGLHPLDFGMGARQSLVMASALLIGIAGDVLHRHRPIQQLSRSTFCYYLSAAALILVIALFGIYGNGFDPQSFIYFHY